MDLVLNAGGQSVGSLAGSAAGEAGVLRAGALFAISWLGRGAGGAVALLALWPFALLFPAALPFGPGPGAGASVHVTLRIGKLEYAPFTAAAAWVTCHYPVVARGRELLCVLLGLLDPVGWAYCVDCRIRCGVRYWPACSMIAQDGCNGLSAALTWGPAHALGVAADPGAPGRLGGRLVALALVPVHGVCVRCCSLVALALHLQLAEPGTYRMSPLARSTCRCLERGRFIGFYGLAQWLGWFLAVTRRSAYAWFGSGAATSLPRMDPA